MTATLRVLAAALVAATAAAAQAQGTITIVSHPLATMPQYTKVDVPLLRDELAKKAKMSVNLAAWSERNVQGPEVLRLVRSGQVDIGAAPLEGAPAGNDLFAVTALLDPLPGVPCIESVPEREHYRDLEAIGVPVSLAHDLTRLPGTAVQKRMPPDSSKKRHE